MVCALINITTVIIIIVSLFRSFVYLKSMYVWCFVKRVTLASNKMTRKREKKAQPHAIDKQRK